MSNDLHPTLWRTCRVIACEKRLMLLWALFEQKELCVSQLAGCADMGPAQASLQLRALNARGLITAQRNKTRVFYRPVANSAVEHAPEILDGLKWCHAHAVSFESVIRNATAFTHPRRIQLAQVLSRSEMGWNDLLDTTGMVPSSLLLHVRKLEARRCLENHRNHYRLLSPANRFASVLLKAVLVNNPFL